ncbi:hypothetical protein ACFFRR_009886 [Megaselia abdita]
MTPSSFYNLISLRLSFSRKPNLNQPMLSKKSDSISMSYHTIDWFEQILIKESSLTNNKLTLDLCELQIKTGDIKLFNMNGDQYKKIHIILGQERAYWIFYNSNSEEKGIQRMEGSGVLPISY